MAMGMLRFRFSERPDEGAWRARLRDAAGSSRADPRCVETEWAPDGDGSVLTVLSMDGVALAYAARVCVELGATHVPLTASGVAWSPPAWTSSRWRDLPWLTRARIWLGPTRL